MAADALGDPTPSMQGRITLNPFKHLDLLGSFILPLLTYAAGGFIFGWAKPVEFNPYNLRNQRWGEALIALAGPASNLAIAGVSAALFRYSSILGLNDTVQGLLAIVVVVNISLALFNMIPVPPLDGSKVLFSLLPLHMRHVREKIENMGLILFVLVVLLAGSILNPILRFIVGAMLGV